ncbi:hypothetical protein K2X33_02765 [bacterium]|nr:hypothetical protein [bacterium]
MQKGLPAILALTWALHSSWAADEELENRKRVLECERAWLAQGEMNHAQRMAIHATIAHLNYHNSELPPDWKQRFGFDAFSSTEKALLTLRQEIKKRQAPVTFSLISFGLKAGASEEYRTAFKEDCLDAYVDHYVKTGKTPNKWMEQVGFKSDQFYGMGLYGKEKRDRHLSIFSSQEEAILAVRERAKERGVSFPLFKVTFKAPRSEKYKALEREDALNAYLDWVKIQGLSQITEAGWKKIGLDRERFTGQKRYSIGKPFEHRRIFDSREKAFLALKEQAARRGIPFSLIDIEWRDGYSAALRKELQKESVDRVLAWVKANKGRTPQESSWHSGDKGLNLDREAFFGIGKWAEGSEWRATALFNNPSEALLALAQRARQLGVPLRLLDFEFTNIVPSKDLRLAWQGEATDIAADWLRQNPGKILSNDSFGGLGIPTTYQRFYGMGDPNQAIFPNHADAWLAIKDKVLTLNSKAAQAAQAAGKPAPQPIRFSLLDRRFQGAIPQKFKDAVRREAIEICRDWVTIHKRLPRPADFHKGEGGVGISEDRFFATYYYAPGKAFNGYAIFPSTAQALQALELIVPNQ